MAKPEDTLTLETTKGKVVIEMRPDLAPGHVARIKQLVKDGFYDGIVFHRVIDGFMAQTGCPQGTGTGGSGQKLKAEFNKEPHVRGTVSMARAANPDSGDSQFFICFDDARFLDNQYTAWGKVISGMDNVDKIKRGEPVADPDKIIKATMGALPEREGGARSAPGGDASCLRSDPHPPAFATRRRATSPCRGRYKKVTPAACAAAAARRGPADSARWSRSARAARRAGRRKSPPARNGICTAIVR